MCLCKYKCLFHYRLWPEFTVFFWIRIYLCSRCPLLREIHKDFDNRIPIKGILAFQTFYIHGTFGSPHLHFTKYFYDFFLVVGVKRAFFCAAPRNVLTSFKCFTFLMFGNIISLNVKRCDLFHLLRLFMTYGVGSCSG